MKLESGRAAGRKEGEGRGETACAREARPRVEMKLFSKRAGARDARPGCVATPPGSARCRTAVFPVCFCFLFF